jgi:uncharacterized membrane protein YhhN
MYKLLNDNFITIYLIFLAIFLVVRSIGNPTLEYVLKPCIMLLLGWYAYQNHADNPVKTLLLSAILFSWLGDIALMFGGGFLYGLGAFLVAHVAYIALFARQTTHFNTQLMIPTLLVISYAMGLFWYLRPHLGGLQIPVFIYSLVLMTMLLFALHHSQTILKPNFNWILIGAIFFVLSDSLLAINKFAQPIKAGGLWVMLTYGLGQLWLVMGCVVAAKKL